MFLSLINAHCARPLFLTRFPIETTPNDRSVQGVARGRSGNSLCMSRPTLNRDYGDWTLFVPAERLSEIPEEQRMGFM